MEDQAPHHTRAEETEATYTLSMWPDPPNDEDATDWGQIFKCILKEWSVQVDHMREDAASEATKADKDDSGEDGKDNNKQTKLKSKRKTGKQKSSSSKKVKFFTLSRAKTVKKLQMSPSQIFQRSLR